MAKKLWVWLQFRSTSLSGRLLYHPHIQVWHHSVSLGTRTVKPVSRLQNGYFKIPMGDATITPSISDCTKEHKQRSNLKGKEGLPLLRLSSGWTVSARNKGGLYFSLDDLTGMAAWKHIDGLVCSSETERELRGGIRRHNHRSRVKAVEGFIRKLLLQKTLAARLWAPSTLCLMTEQKHKGFFFFPVRFSKTICCYLPGNDKKNYPSNSKTTIFCISASCDSTHPSFTTSFHRAGFLSATATAVRIHSVTHPCIFRLENAPRQRYARLDWKVVRRQINPSSQAAKKKKKSVG